LPDKFHPQFLTGYPKWGRQTTEGEKNKPFFLAVNVNISKTVTNISHQHTEKIDE